MPRWVYTKPRRILKGRVVPGHRAPGRWVVVRRLRAVAIRRPRRLIVVGGRTVAATVQAWVLVVRARQRLQIVRRGRARRVAVAGRGEVRSSGWTRLIQRVRERARVAMRPRRAPLDVPPTTVRGTGFPKGGNGWPGSYAGDNATPGSRKGGDGG